MRCPYCLEEKTKVVDKRDIPEMKATRRRRECLKCSRRFTTYERIELVNLTVIKKDGRREIFDRNKLVSGILKSCEKRPISRDKVEILVGAVEADLRNRPEDEVASTVIGELVMDRLRELDKVAYIRFASVYREFADLRSFARELQRLKRKKERSAAKG